MASTEELGKYLREIWRKSTRRKPVEGEVSEVSRCLSTTDLLSMGFVQVLGSGIYVWTGSIMANRAGAGGVLSYLVGGVVALLASLCYAQFAVNVLGERVAYTYVYTVCGELVAFLVGWNLLLEYVFCTAFVGRLLSANIWFLIPGKNSTVNLAETDYHSLPINIDVLAGGVVIASFVLIAIGLKRSTRINIVLAAVNVVAIAIIIVGGFYLGSPKNFDGNHGGFLPFGWSGVFSGAALAFYGYIGFDAVAMSSAEVVNPSRSIPTAMCVSIGTVTLLYCLASMSLSFLEPYYDVSDVVPFPSAFGHYNIAFLKYIVWVGSLLAKMSSLVYQSSRLCKEIHTLAKDGLIAKPFTYLNPWTQTPIVSIVVAAVVTAILALLIDAPVFIDMVAIGSLFALTVLTVSLLKLHYLPAEQCPFELDRDGIIKQLMVSGERPEECMPILNSSSGQILGNIGKLKVAVPLLRGRNPQRAVNWILVVLVVSATGLALILVKGWPFLLQAEWWIVLLLVLFWILFVVSVIGLLVYEHNRSFVKFHIPFVPYLPIVTMFLSLCMMVSLKAVTWIRLGVWLIAGVFVYYSYGISHSTVTKLRPYSPLDRLGRYSLLDGLTPNKNSENTTNSRRVPDVKDENISQD